MPTWQASGHANLTTIKAFLREALAADADIDAGGEMYSADEAHAWLEQLALNRTAAPPKPIRQRTSESVL